MTTIGEIVLGVVTPVLAIAGTALSAYLGRRNRVQATQMKNMELEFEKQKIAFQSQINQHMKVEAERELKIEKYRKPFLATCVDLYNVLYRLDRGSLTVIKSPTELFYLFCQYFCWKEIIRQEIQVLDLSDIKDNLKLTTYISLMETAFNTSSVEDEHFNFTQLEQRAIGESLMILSSNGSKQCIGYSEFLHRYHNNQEFKEWLKNLVEFKLEDYHSSLRLKYILYVLGNLIRIIDPDGRRIQEYTIDGRFWKNIERDVKQMMVDQMHRDQTRTARRLAHARRKEARIDRRLEKNRERAEKIIGETTQQEETLKQHKMDLEKRINQVDPKKSDLQQELKRQLQKCSNDLACVADLRNAKQIESSDVTSDLMRIKDETNEEMVRLKSKIGHLKERIPSKRDRLPIIKPVLTDSNDGNDSDSSVLSRTSISSVISVDDPFQIVYQQHSSLDDAVESKIATTNSVKITVEK